MRNHFYGFTLIEMLVVVLIIGISLTFVLLKSQPNVEKNSARLATHLSQLISFAEQQALSRPAQLGLHLTKEGYEILHDVYDPTEKNEHWQPIKNTSAFRFHAIDPALTLSLFIDHQQITLADNTPQIMFWPSGEMTPFIIEIGNRKNKTRIQVIGQSNGKVMLAEQRGMS